ncbi:MAG: histidine kinase [Pseudonocardiaceae bacterium]
MVSIQAGAALRVFDRDPEQARQALRLIHHHQQSLADLRRTLGLLRQPEHERAGAPPPAPGWRAADDLHAPGGNPAWRHRSTDRRHIGGVDHRIDHGDHHLGVQTVGSNQQRRIKQRRIQQRRIQHRRSIAASSTLSQSHRRAGMERAWKSDTP